MDRVCKLNSAYIFLLCWASKAKGKYSIEDTTFIGLGFTFALLHVMQCSSQNDIQMNRLVCLLFL